MITKEIKSVVVNWNNDTIEILEEFDSLKDIACVRTNTETGVIEADIWYSSTITCDRMTSNVIEYIKFPGFEWMKKPSATISGRYIDQKMTLDNSTYCQVEKDENGIITGFDESVDNEHLEDDLTKEILDEEGNSYVPKQYEQKVKEGWYQTFSLFKQYTNIINLMYSTMSKR